jgi:hypothetical protein
LTGDDSVTIPTADATELMKHHIKKEIRNIARKRKPKEGDEGRQEE